ncbi:hypothetical protein BKA57DRAFT_458436 [Linnemannia elongata]|nr:hypothetical protein BKA57DRAFT_458436 [Linnemannia elongata]
MCVKETGRIRGRVGILFIFPCQFGLFPIIHPSTHSFAIEAFDYFIIYRRCRFCFVDSMSFICSEPEGWTNANHTGRVHYFFFVFFLFFYLIHSNVFDFTFNRLTDCNKNYRY